MSVIAVGPALDIDGPIPVAPPHSLLNTPGVVVERDSEGRWLNGVNVWGYPSDTPLLWEPCSDGTFRTKSDESNQPTARFDSFVAYLPITCSGIGISEAEMDDLRDRAERALDATISMAVEEALAAGIDQSTNPFFADTNVDILNSGTAVSPAVGLSFLENAIGTTGRRGLLHATPAVIAQWQPYFVDSPELLTANGTPAASGDGYIGVDTPFIGTPGTGEDWAFATGPVNVYLGPLVITDTRETLDRSNNDLTFRAERYVLALWDTALQSAVLIDWTS